MVDRTIIYTGQIPVDTNILSPQRNTMVGIGALAQAVIGEQAASPAVAVDGFTLSVPVGPGGLVLNVGPGSIYAQGVVDQSAFGSLPADITDSITLQGISIAPVPLTFTPPGTVGFSTNYLVQVGLSVQDGNPIVLPYYNASNPTIPWLGPSNTGVPQNTTRNCAAIVQAKAGIAASTGTQVTPSPDPGFYGLYSVTVANGATALSSGNFSTLATAPFIPSTLMAIPQNVQSSRWTFAADTGTANALVVALNPTPLAIVQGMRINVYKGASANSAQASINVNGTGAVAIHTLSGLALNGGEMPPRSMLTLAFDGTYWQLQTVTPTNFGGPLYDGDALGTNTYTISDLLPSTPPALFNRMLLKAGFANPNTSSATLNIGLGSNPIIFANGNPLSGGEITDVHFLCFSTPKLAWELLTPTIAPTALQPSLVHQGVDTSVVVNTITANVSPAITSYAAGHLYVVTAIANANTSGITANFNGIGTRVVVHQNGTAVLPGEVTGGQSLVLADNGSQLQIVYRIPVGANMQTFQAGGFYTPSAGRQNALMLATGGGGGGGAYAGGGGGSGSTSGSFVSLVGMIPQTVTVGAGGAGGIYSGVSSAQYGGNGGTSSVGTIVSAGGGFGGYSGLGPGPPYADGGPPGIATTGQFLANGTPGTADSTMGAYQSGCGAPSFWGGGGYGPAAFGSSANGGAGSLGGGGGGTDWPGMNGGPGGGGFVFILEF